MKKSILLAILWLTSFAGVAAEWRFFDKVLYKEDFAIICHFWNATIFAPGEKPSCFIGTVFAADLMKREIYYALDGEGQGMSRSSSDRQLTRDVLINSLKGEGVERLESIRAAQIAANDAAKEKAAAEEARATYFGAFQAATTLERIKGFETRYAQNDPDGLIEKLGPRRGELQYKQYRDEFSQAKSSSELSRFISTYEQSDQDKLVPEAKKRLVATLQADEKARLAKEAEVQQKIKVAAATEAAERNAYPNAWKCKSNTYSYFSGGWITGAGGNGFIDPARLLDSVLSKSEQEKARLTDELPLTIHFSNRGGEDGCTGIARIEARRVVVSAPQGGGKIRGGKFLVVLTELKSQRGLNATCYILVQSKDVTCD